MFDDLYAEPLIITLSLKKLKLSRGTAETYTKLYNKPNLKLYISNEYRKGDNRHCYADITKAQKLLNFKLKITLQNGLTELTEWAKTHGWGAIDLFEKALKELRGFPYAIVSMMISLTFK